MFWKVSVIALLILVETVRSVAQPTNVSTYQWVATTNIESYTPYGALVYSKTQNYASGFPFSSYNQHPLVRPGEQIKNFQFEYTGSGTCSRIDDISLSCTGSIASLVVKFTGIYTPEVKDGHVIYTDADYGYGYSIDYRNIINLPKDLTFSSSTPQPNSTSPLTWQIPNFQGNFNLQLLLNDDRIAQQSDKIWTIMLYLDGDNDLEAGYKELYQVLDNLKVNDGITVVALLDGTTANDTEYKVITSAGSHYIAAGGEYNMGDPQYLEIFINYARQNFPADHYALALRDHGSGVNGAIYDMSSKKDNLTVQELGVALNAATLNGIKPIDVLFMDACLMGMVEDAYEIRNAIKYYVASESIGLAYKGFYESFLSAITSTTSPEQLAQLIAYEYYSKSLAYVAYYGGHASTISVADIQKLEPLVIAINAISKSLSSRPNDITQIIQHVQRFDSNNDSILSLADEYIDLFDFARLISEHATDQQIQQQAMRVMQSVKDYITLNLHTSGGIAGTSRLYNLDHSSGVSIFFSPKRATYYNSLNLSFATGADWNQPSIIQANDINTWGGMLVNYIQTTNPNAEIDISPPDLVGLVEMPEIYTLYFPSIMH